MIHFTIIIIKMMHFWGTPQVTVFSLEKHIGYRWKEWPRDETWYIQFAFSFFTWYRSIRFHTAGTLSPKYFPVWLRNGVDMNKHAEQTVRDQEMKKSADKYSNVFYDMLTNVPGWFGLFGQKNSLCPIDFPTRILFPSLVDGGWRKYSSRSNF